MVVRTLKLRRFGGDPDRRLPTYPFAYLADDRVDLSGLLELHLSGSEPGRHQLGSPICRPKETETVQLVATMNGAMHEGVHYVRQRSADKDRHFEIWRWWCGASDRRAVRPRPYRASGA
jgi:hypothetical protein